MKKAIILFLILIIACFSVTAFADDSVTVIIDGTTVECTDALGQKVSPFIVNGTTYVPLRAIGEAFGKRVQWDNASNSVIITTPLLKTDFDSDTTYAIISKSDGKALTVSDSLSLQQFNSLISQGFKLIPSDTEGFYYINSLANGKNFDINSNSKAPGASVITYAASNADNQKFAIEEYGGGYIIYALSSQLPIENSAGRIKQNTIRGSIVQKWEIIPFTPSESEALTVLYTIEADGKKLIDNSSAFTLGGSDSSDALWLLSPNEDGEYIITNKFTSKSIDVANNSKASGDPVITYQTSSDPNQRWTFEKNDDGTYLIKSVHSNLYLTLSDDLTLIQSEKSAALKQCWSLKMN